MIITEIKVGDKLLSEPLTTLFEVIKVNRLTIKVRNTETGYELTAFPAIFTRKKSD